MFSRAIEQHACADDIGVNEVERRIDAAIDVRLRRKINYGITLRSPHERIHFAGVGNVGFEKLITLAMFLGHTIEIGRISRISEDVHISDRGGLVMFQNISNKVAPNESTAARNQYAH